MTTALGTKVGFEEKSTGIARGGEYRKNQVQLIFPFFQEIAGGYEQLVQPAADKLRKTTGFPGNCSVKAATLRTNVCAGWHQPTVCTSTRTCPA